MPIDNRDWYRGKHPSTCNCKDCTDRKLNKIKDGSCPRCGSSNIIYNNKYTNWRCNKCEASFQTPSRGVGRKISDIPSKGYTRDIASVDSEYREAVSSSKETKEDTKEKQEESNKTPNLLPKELGRCPICGEWSLWCNTQNSLFECQNNRCGVTGTSRGNLTKAKGKSQRRYLRRINNLILKPLIKLILNLFIIVGLGLLIKYGYQFFATPQEEPLKNSLIFITGLVAWFVAIKLSRGRSTHYWFRYKGTKPSFKLTAFVGGVILLVLTFAGVPPMSTYKDNLVVYWNEYQAERVAELDEQEAKRKAEEGQVVRPPTEISTQVLPEETAKVVSETESSILNRFDSNTGVYKTYYLGLVDTPGGIISGNDCYGDFIILINNAEARNPTYSQLLTFLKDNGTDKFPYQPVFSVISFYYGKAEDTIDLDNIKDILDGVSNPIAPKVCSDFAERLHNDAELAGIRAGYVSLELVGYTDPAGLGIPSNTGHSLNVFETVDRGLIFIDSTGSVSDYEPLHGELTTTSLKIGEAYNPKFLFPTDWIMPEGQMGIITNIDITWDGKWR